VGIARDPSRKRCERLGQRLERDNTALVALAADAVDEGAAVGADVEHNRWVLLAQQANEEGVEAPVVAVHPAKLKPLACQQTPRRPPDLLPHVHRSYRRRIRLRV
jgi:hypothetical protein